MPYRLALDLRSEPMTQSGRYWKPHSPLATLLYQQVRHAVKLRRGERASFPSSGHSLWPKVCSGDRCVYEPVFDDKDVSEGDIVFRHINKRSYFRYFAHRVLDNIIWEGDLWYLIGNARGHSNGYCRIDTLCIAAASRLHRGCISHHRQGLHRGCISHHRGCIHLRLDGEALAWQLGYGSGSSRQCTRPTPPGGPREPTRSS